ncbi:MAG: SNF2 helicase associated domain-containing protein [Actinobacteria bacterium]|nr:SNF2 helicase associated domain-containing protein [Actinomycetota bacterium]
MDTMQISAHALDTLRDQVPMATLGEALRLLQRGAVFEVNRERVRGVLEVEFVIDEPARPVSTLIRFLSGEGIDARCTCARPEPCPHAAAGYLRVITDAENARGERSELVPQRPAWQRELDAVLSAGPVTDVERCVFFGMHEEKHTRYRYNDDTPKGPYPALRAGVRGTRGSWIKGQSSWSRLQNEVDHSATAAVLAGIPIAYALNSGYGHYGYYAPDWIPVDAIAGRELWDLLIRIRDAGIAIVFDDKAQRPVELREHETPVAEAQLSRRGGALSLTGATEVENAAEGSETFWIGSPPMVYAELIDEEAGRGVVLRRASQPLSTTAVQLLRRKAAMRIPPDEAPMFLTDYLPRLQSAVTVRSPDGSVEIPKPPQSELLLRITHTAPQLHLSWDWQRPGGARDLGRERGVLEDVRSAFGSHAAFLEAPASASRAEGAPPADRTLGQAHAVLFVTEVLPALQEIEGLRLEQNEQLPEYRAAAGLPVVGVSSESDGDWFDLHITVTVDGESVDFSELFTALALDDPIFVLPSGTFFPLDAPEFDQLRAIIEEARALTDKPTSELRVSRYQVDLWQELAELGMVTAQESAWWLAVQSLGSGDVLEQVAAPAGLRATLRDYQQAGLSWLHFLRTHGLGGVLADDMGLGKTLQAIAMMEIAREEDPQRPPFLVVAPTSVVGNWAAECAKFAPGLTVTTISAMAGRKRGPLADEVRGSHVVVTSYALFRGEADAYRELEWSGLLLDEAQQIKNAASQGYKAARTLGAPFTIVITGTPMENNLDELWALVSLAAPGLLGSRKQFGETYRRPIEKAHDGELLTRLQRRIRPFLLRRTKDLVASELPPKQEQVLDIELHPKHRKLYDVHFQRERQKVLGLIDDVDANRFQIFRSLMKLRQLALDPALGDIGDAPSAKLDALIELLVEAAEEGHRVLVLSQFTQFLGAARDRAATAGLAFAYLDGATVKRDKVISDFRTGTDPVFFVSLRAGGFGLNLVEIDYVVLLDPWWNPAVEEQAIDRAHRIGQTRPVIVYRLVSRNTIEEKVIALRESKAALFARVFDGEGAVQSGALTADDIRGLLE